MKLVYTVEISEEIYCIDGLHQDLDRVILTAGLDIKRSEFESDDEVSENDYEENFDE